MANLHSISEAYPCKCEEIGDSGEVFGAAAVFGRLRARWLMEGSGAGTVAVELLLRRWVPRSRQTAPPRGQLYRPCGLFWRSGSAAAQQGELLGSRPDWRLGG